MAIETLDTYLFVTTEPNVHATEAAPGLYAWIEQAPLLLSEVQKQQADLTLLASTPLLEPSVLHRLRQSSQGIGIQPFKRGLVQEP
jgi:hypothetical protein